VIEISVKFQEGHSFEYYSECAPRKGEIISFEIDEHEIYGYYKVKEVKHRVIEIKDEVVTYVKIKVKKNNQWTLNNLFKGIKKLKVRY
jgi:hypothetical protein